VIKITDYVVNNSINTKQEIEALKFAIDGLQTVIKVNGSLLAKTNHKLLRIEEKVKNLEVKNNLISKKPKQTTFTITDTNKR